MGSTAQVNQQMPQPVQLSQQDLYMSTEDHAKRLAQDLQEQAARFQQLAQQINANDQKNYDIYQKLENYSLLLDKLNDKQEEQKSQINNIRTVQKQIYEGLASRPRNTDGQLRTIVRMMTEVEQQIDNANSGAVELIQEVQEQADVLSKLLVEAKKTCL